LGFAGGGGNFGIVTTFTYRLHQVGSIILGGMLIWRSDDAESLLQFYHKYAAGVPEELTTMAAFMTAPAAPFIPPAMQGKPSVAVVGGYVGSIDDGKRIITPLKEFSSPAIDLFTEMPYVALQSMLDGMAPAGIRNYWKSDYFEALNDGIIHTLIERFEEVPSPMTHIDTHDLGGAT